MNREELINQGYFSIIKDERFNNGFKVSKFRARSTKPKTYLFNTIINPTKNTTLTPPAKPSKPSVKL